MKHVIITTDGSCFPNPGKGGWAAILRFGTASKEISGSSANTTNNVMELRAILEGVKAVREPCAITVRSDSHVAMSWCKLHAFQKLSKRAKFPEQFAMWKEFLALNRKHRIAFEWVRGHNGDPDNERCDVLANDARLRPF